MSTQADRPLLIVLTGPTGIGKSALALTLAQKIGCSIVSADSRQVYKQIPIGTAAPSPTDLAAVPHYFVGCRDVWEAYSAADYETDVLKLLPLLFREKTKQLLCGGSMMYVDAVCSGIDFIPSIPQELRSALWCRFETEGVEPLAEELFRVDPEYLKRIDPRNHKRIIHALEVFHASGKPYSSFHTHKSVKRPFDTLKICLTMEREQLYRRINQRVDLMMTQGLEEEARAVWPYRSLNALNTLGYKEMFAYFDGQITLDEAVDLIRRNSRHYARKQLAWWRRDPEMNFVKIREDASAMKIIEELLEAQSPT